MQALLRQNSPVVNWWCWQTHIDLYNGHRMIVVGIGVFGLVCMSLFPILMMFSSGSRPPHSCWVLSPLSISVISESFDAVETLNYRVMQESKLLAAPGKKDDRYFTRHCSDTFNVCLDLCNDFITDLLLSLAVREFKISVSIWRSYWQENSGTWFIVAGERVFVPWCRWHIFAVWFLPRDAVLVQHMP